jgi:hypothetical protein
VKRILVILSLAGLFACKSPHYISTDAAKSYHDGYVLIVPGLARAAVDGQALVTTFKNLEEVKNDPALLALCEEYLEIYTYTEDNIVELDAAAKDFEGEIYYAETGQRIAPSGTDSENSDNNRSPDPS